MCIEKFALILNLRFEIVIKKQGQNYKKFIAISLVLIEDSFSVTLSYSLCLEDSINYF